MGGKKTVEPGHTVVTGDNVGADSGNTTALDALTEGGAPYELGMAPLAASPDALPAEPNATPPDAVQSGTGGAGNEGTIKDTLNQQNAVGGKSTDAEDKTTPPDGDEDSGMSVVVLKKGATFRSRGIVYTKDVPAPVAPDVAERLIKTGLFERG